MKTLASMNRTALFALLGLLLVTGLPSKAAALSPILLPPGSTSGLSLPSGSVSPASTVAHLSPTFLVTRTADDNAPGSLRSAITLASAAGGTVNFQIPATDPGFNSATNTATITLALGEMDIAASLSIAGPNQTGGGPIVVNANVGSRVFNIGSGTVSFSSLTIQNGVAAGHFDPFGNSTGTPGGGILNHGALTLTNCTILGCSADASVGGGICNLAGGTLLMTGCTITGNEVNNLSGGNSSGGGLYNAGTATLNNCILSRNVTTLKPIGPYFGGGGAANAGTLTMNSCQITTNTCNIQGGGIENGGTMTLNACTISKNTGENINQQVLGKGGGIDNQGTAQITNCLIINNDGFLAGGMNNEGTLTLVNSTFAGNIVSTASSNYPDIRVGGLRSGPATLMNDIFFFDTAFVSGTAVVSEIGTPVGLTPPTVTYSDVQGGYPGTGNINADPQFVRNPNLRSSPIDPGDEHLKLTSPAVYAGANGPLVPLTDIEGTPRPTPPATPSMGAYEIPGTTSFSAQGGFTVTGTQNLDTGAQVVAKFLPGVTPPAGFTALVDFGDGVAVPGTIAPDPTVAGVYQVSANHTYTGYGTFPITVVISGPGGTPTATVTSTAKIQPAQIAGDVTSQIGVFRGGAVYSRATQRYVQTVTLTNTGSTPLTGPFSLVLDGLTSGASLASASGVTQYAPPLGSPYQNAAAVTLAPGASTSVVLQLSYTGSARLDYSSRILAGPGAR